MAKRCHFYISRALHAFTIVKRSHLVASFSQAFYQTLSLPSQNQNQYAPFDFNLDLDDPDLLQFLQFLKKDDDHSLTSLEPNRDLVCSAIWVLREDWKPALRAFKWNSRYNDEKACNLMIWVLGTHAKFSTAWSIIRDMHASCLSTHHAMLIIIDRYITFPYSSYEFKHKIIFPLYCNLHVHLHELLAGRKESQDSV